MLETNLTKENTNKEKNCKTQNTNKKCKNNKKESKNGEKCLKNQDILIKQAYETNLISYIKALLGIYKNLPNIIGILDKIIEQRATTLVPTNTIYGDSYLQTMNQINKVINLTERKDKLLNLYVIIENIINSLDYTDRKIAILRYTKKYTCLEIANETNITERSVFRKLNRLLEKIAVFMLKQNWNTKFLDNQIGNEAWIYDAIKQTQKEDRKKKD